MARERLTDEQWELIEDLLPQPAATGRPPVDRRMVIDGILWVLRTGAPWRDVPSEFGAWKTVWRLFDAWTADGTLDQILHCLRAGHIAEAEDLWCIDGTLVRAARCAAGGGKKAILRNRLIMP